MALLEAEADAIMQFVHRRRDGNSSNASGVEININDGDGANTADTPHVPPVHGSVGLGGQNAQQRESEESAESVEPESASGEQSGETPMETDKPGVYNSTLFVTFSNTI